MIVYPIITNDGTYLHDAKEVERYLEETVGISIWDLEVVSDGYDSLLASRDEQEMIADEYCSRMSALCDEMREVARRLESGKRGSGYTKEYLAGVIMRAINNYGN